MKTVKIKAGSNIELLVEISSEAVVDSLIRLNGKKIRTSELNKFKVDLGLIDNIDNSELSCRSGFYVLTGDFEAIYDNTIVKYTLKFDEGEETLNGVKAKFYNDIFIALNKFNLIKI